MSTLTRTTALAALVLTLACPAAAAAGRSHRDLARHHHVVASSAAYQRRAARAVDGRAATRWRAAAWGAQWLYVDLRRDWTLMRIRVSDVLSGRRGYRVQVSLDRRTWTTVARRRRGGVVLVRDALLARYVRVIGFGGRHRHFALGELAVFGRSPRPPAARQTAGAAEAIGPASVGCGWGTFADTANFTLPSACWRPFADSSWLNTRLPDAPRLAQDGVDGENGDSAQLVAALMNHGTGAVRDLTPVIGTSWQHAMYFSSVTDPVYTLSCADSTRNCDQVNSAAGQPVHIPCGATVPNGTDMQMFVIDQASGYEYDVAALTPGQRLCGGGVLEVSLATRVALNGDGRGSCAADSACVAMSAGQVREPELQAGAIDHAIFVVDGNCDNSGTPQSLYPADPTNSCGGGRPGAPRVGQWYYLALSDAQIDATAFPDWQKTILRALAHYGMFVGDQGSNGAFDIFTEDQRTWSSFDQPNPWVAYARRLATDPANDIRSATASQVDFGMDDIPRSFWVDNLRAVDPCVIQRSC